jgi:HD-GYP domain-containing protein (c-di-GMP phosphodiesterase class II)
VESYLQFATLALEGQHMLQQRKALFSSLIEMVASAIDAKSKYTGGHCQRVPELTLALAQSACECKEGHLTDFDLSDDEWEEAIVDKATNWKRYITVFIRSALALRC